jgi:hypothetical protein
MTLPAFFPLDLLVTQLGCVIVACRIYFTHDGVHVSLLFSLLKAASQK